jgi:hypothetical protein
VLLQVLALDGIHSAPRTLETYIPRGEFLTKPQCFDQANFASFDQPLSAISGDHRNKAGSTPIS